MNARDKEILEQFRQRLPDRLKSCLKKMIIYGSRIRGDATEDSDLDLVVLVEKKTSEIERELDDIAYQVMWEFDFDPMISLKVFSHSQFEDAARKGFSFYRKVIKEGVAV